MEERKEHLPGCPFPDGYGCNCAQIECDNWFAEESKRVEAQAVIWKAQWPNHCPTCIGYGGHEESQRHPYGSTTATETWFEPCDNCIGTGRCPRCFHRHGEEWEGKRCEACGWDHQVPDACPWFEP